MLGMTSVIMLKLRQEQNAPMRGLMAFNQI